MLGIINSNRVMVGLLMVLAMISMQATGVTAEERRLVKGEWRLPENYPKGFHDFGCFQALNTQKKYIVIDDRNIKIAESVRFFTPDEEDVRPDEFPTGVLVGYLVDDDNLVETIWLVKEACENN